MADVDQAENRHSGRRLRVRLAVVSLLAAPRRRGARDGPRELDEPAAAVAGRFDDSTEAPQGRRQADAAGRAPGDVFADARRESVPDGEDPATAGVAIHPRD